MARLIDSIIGHQDEITKLLKLKKINRWPHAMMFVGPSGIGKKKLALAMAQSLVCQESEEACGACGPCVRIEKLQSESLILVEPDYEAAKPSIKVERIRDLLSSLSLASISQARIVIIDQAHLMNSQASNALLKTLEEPTENIFFILIANDVYQFLPTIRSRVQVMRFHSLSYDQLKNIRPNQPDWIYRSSRGQIDRFDLLLSTDGSEKREEALQFFDRFFEDKDFLFDKSWRDDVKDRSWSIFILNIWMQLVRDAVIFKNDTQKFILNTDQMPRLKKIGDVSFNKLLWLGQHLSLAETDLNRNADAALVFEDLWVQYARMD